MLRASACAAGTRFMQALSTVMDLEFVGFQSAVAGLPAVPGQVRYADSGEPVLLHYAPGRWFAPAADDSLRLQLEALEAAGEGALFDVTGKFRSWRLDGTEGRLWLAQQCEVAMVLAGRDCAALTLFDCPALLTKRQLDGHENFVVWLASSAAEALPGSVAECCKNTT
jgi:hypothetical protein